MRIALFGATGRTGKILLEKLIHEGFEINVLVRNPKKLNPFSQKINVIIGDVTNYDNVFQTIESCQAVISAIGYVRGSKSGFQTLAVNHMVKAMNQLQVKRIIVLTGSGVPHKHDVFTIGNWLLTSIIKLVANDRYTDGVNQVNVLQNSDLEWTVVRAPLLTNGNEKGNFKTGYLPLGLFSRISRADVAQFIVDVLKNNNYIYQMPQICY